MRPLRLVALLSFACILAACDSDGDGGGAAGELTAANAKIGAAVAVGLSPGGTAARIRPVRPCAGGGSVDVSQSGTSYDMTFTDCGDVSGTLDVALTSGGSIASSRTRFDGDLRVRNSCEVSYDAFRTTTDIDLATRQTTLTYDGAIDATCPSGATACQFDGATFEVSATGSGAPTDLSAYCD